MCIDVFSLIIFFIFILFNILTQNLNLNVFFAIKKFGFGPFFILMNKLFIIIIIIIIIEATQKCDTQYWIVLFGYNKSMFSSLQATQPYDNTYLSDIVLCVLLNIVYVNIGLF